MDGFEATLGLVVEKGKIAANGEYNLNGERYRESGTRTSQFSLVSLSEVVDILDNRRKPITKHDRKPGPYPYYGATGVLDHVEGYLFDEPLVLVGEDGAKWESGEQSAFPVEGKVWVNNHAHVLRPRRDRLLDRFLIEVLNEADLTPYVTGVTVPKLNQGKLKSIQIPLPPLEVQKEIVAEIEGYQKVIDGARAIVDNYRPQITADPNWPMVPIGDICDLVNGRAFKPRDWEDVDSGGLPIVRIQNLNTPDSRFNYYTGEVRNRFIINEGQLLFSWSGSRGTSFGAHIWNGGKAVLNQHIFKVVYDNERAIKLYLFHALNKAVTQIEDNLHGGVGLVHITKGNLEKIQISLPPLEMQKEIVAEIKVEQALVNANHELIGRLEKKIQDTLARTWSEDESAPAKA